jgi:hypothetical protein
MGAGCTPDIDGKYGGIYGGIYGRIHTGMGVHKYCIVKDTQ